MKFMTGLLGLLPCLFSALFAPLCATEIRVQDIAALTTAIAAAQPGDSIVMADGTWPDLNVNLEVEGTPEAPIVLRAETPGQVVLSGQSSIQIGGRHLVVEGLYFKDGVAGERVIAFRGASKKEASHCRVTGCAIVDYNAALPSKKTTHWMSLYGTDNRVDHCYFKGKNDAGPIFTVWVGDGPNRHRIDHNYFAGRPPLGRNGGETLRVGTSQVSMTNSRTTVESNFFEHCDGETEIISNKSCENIYRHNAFADCQGTLTLRHGDRCTVEGNWFFGNNRAETGGIRIIGEDHRVYNNYLSGLTGSGFKAALSLVAGIPDSPDNGYFQVKNAVVAFNTIIGCRHNLVIGAGHGSRDRTLPPLDCTFASNVIVATDNPAVELESEPLNAKWLGNVVSGQPGVQGESGVTVLDPLLAKDADGLWRPGPATPLLDEAEGNFPFVAQDIDGQPRGETPDIGCDEHSSAPILRHPPNRENTGPDWMRHNSKTDSQE